MSANRDELSPLALLRRSALAYPDRPAVRDGERQLTFAELAERAWRLGNALRGLGVAPEERVAMLSLNRAELLEAHFGVPASGGALCAINTRLAPPEVRFIVGHCGAQVLLLDPELEEAAGGAAQLPGLRVVRLGPEYEALLEAARTAPPDWPDGEDRPISVDYTSGTTGTPKGVVYTHRGAYLGALAGLVETRLGPDSRYLWTLPMFHCNGWCFSWGVAGVGATSVVLRRPEPGAVWRELRAGATHLCAAPTVLITLLAHADAAPLGHEVTCVVGGAPPSPTLIERCQALGIRLSHMYGLTETYGPATVAAWPPEWDELPPAERAVRRARQGVPIVLGGGMDVWDGEGAPVLRDGLTMGEVVLRGNTVMAAYLDDPAATAEAFRGGWLHSGDAAVVHPDGRIELRDRFKDVIVSGGENISTIEVEQALARHPAVLDCAVVGIPDDHWGERPKAFVELRPGMQATAEELTAFCREQLAGFKCPDQVEYGSLPRTATGKVQKFVLREREWAGRERRVN
ncbi:MAG TPA: AMP-binding protein [Gaiellales bacterium]|nr:AMP-binding protein [Gaiellales bacterium]